MKVSISWSGGKDSAVALSLILADPRYEVTTLLTTFSAEFDRVSMHGIRRSVLEEQARAIGLPLQQVVIGSPRGEADSSYLDFPTNNTYEQAMLAAFRVARERGVEAIVFGDIYLEELRAYRDNLLANAGVAGIYPLWKMSSADLYSRFEEARLEAVIICVDERKLEASWLGVRLGRDVVANFPDDVDPCGENGEFHSFVTNGTFFKRRLETEQVQRVRREPFWFLDLVCTTAQ